MGKAYLKPGLTFEILDAIASRRSDDQAAEQLQKTRRELFATIYEQEKRPALANAPGLGPTTAVIRPQV